MKLILGFIFFFSLLSQVFAESPIPIELIQNTKKVSLVFVGSKDGISESSFGHIALRFSPNQELSIFDTNIQFVAKLEQGEGLLKKYAKGMGIFGNFAYDVTVEIEPFINYQLTKTKNEDRDVYVYPLNLSSEQIQALVNYIQNFFSQDTAAKYRFFNKNCSFFAADALEEATGLDFKVKSHPWRLENELRRHGLISQDIYHPSLSSLKNQVISELFKSELAEHLEKLTNERDFTKNLFSEVDVNRRHAYLQLLSLAFRSPFVVNDHNLKSEAITFYKKLYATESETGKLYYRALLESTTDESLVHLRASIPHSQRPRFKSHFKHELLVNRDLPVLKIRWKDVDNRNEQLALHMNFLQYNEEDHQIYFKNQKVGSALFTRNKDWISPTHINYSVQLERNEVQAIFHLSMNSAILNKENQSDDSSILAINNMTDFDKGYAGACYAMVKIQKALLTRASFFPDEEVNSSLDKIALIDQIYRGQYIAIPGYKDIHDFTSDINKEDLKEYLVKIEHEINGDAVQSFKDGLFRRQKVTKDTFKNLASLIKSGHKTELIIGMTDKGSKRFKPVSHVVLATEIEESDDQEGWNIKVYDPNMGYYTAHLGLDFKIQLSKFYRKDLDYYAVLNVLNKDEIDLELGIENLNLNQEKISKRVKRGQPFVYNPLKYILY